MNSHSRSIVLTQIFLIFILPILLLYFNIAGSGWRLFFLCVSSLLIYGIVKYENWDHFKLGLRHDNFKKAIPVYSVFTILAVGFIFWLDSQFMIGSPSSGPVILQKLLFFLPISFMQEFAFRAFLIPRLQILFKDAFTIVFVNTLLFTFIHIIYPGLGIVLPLTFLGGIFFAILYLKYPNLLLIGLSHSAINIVAVLLGFFEL